jgi:hypothetical protein
MKPTLSAALAIAAAIVLAPAVARADLISQPLGVPIGGGQGFPVSAGLTSLQEAEGASNLIFST